jgi:predicted PilT family ATPase
MIADFTGILQPFCRPNKPLAGIQDAVLRTVERIIGDESPTGLKLPHKAGLRMLLFKYQIGAVMGKKGAAINEIRNKSGATVKLTTPQPGAPIVACAEHDDELITVSVDARLLWPCLAFSAARAGPKVQFRAAAHRHAVVLDSHAQHA